jgi:hypothetical protein
MRYEKRVTNLLLEDDYAEDKHEEENAQLDGAILMLEQQGLIRYEDEPDEADKDDDEEEE